MTVALAAGGAACSGGGSDGSAKPPSDSQQTTAPAPTTTTVVDDPTDIALPTSAAAVATSLTRVERALRDASTPAADIPRLGWEQQVGYRALSGHPEWLAGALAALPSDVAPIVTAITDSSKSLSSITPPQPQLPDWTIETPPAPDVLVGYYREAEATFGIPWPYLAAIHFVETRMGRIHGNSTAGAQGPMQFIQSTWDTYGRGDINDNHDAILAAGRYLAARGGPADMRKALFAYNNSNSYVDAVQHYADLIAAGQELVYRGFYYWQVYYSTVQGTALLPEGYPAKPAVFLKPAS